MFLHGLCENESYWNHHRDRTGTTYAAMLAERGWTPLMLRANTGLPLRENGAALTSLLQRVVEAWPVAGDPDRPGRPLPRRAGDAGGRRGRQ